MNQNNNLGSNFEIELKQIRNNLFEGEIPNSQIMENAVFYLAIKSVFSVTEKGRLVTDMHRGIKITSPVIIDTVIQCALPGLYLTNIASPFTDSHAQDDFHFFELDMIGSSSMGIKNEMKMAIYIPDSIPFTDIKLFAILT